MTRKKFFSKKNIIIFLGVTSVYFCFSLVNYFFSKSSGQFGLGGIISFGGGNDSFFYWQQALDYYKNSKTVLADTSIYVPLVAYIIKFIGILDPLVIKYFNYIGFLLAFSFVLQMNKTVSTQNLRIRNSYSMLYFLVYPSMIFMVTVGIYRDIWILAFQILSSILYIKFFQTKKILFLFIGLISNYVLTEFRGYAGLAMLLSLLIIAMIEMVSRRRIKQIFLGVALGFILWYSFFKEVTIPVVNMSLMDALRYRTATIDLYSGGSTLGIRLDQSNVFMFLLNYFYSFLSNLVGPLINQWKSSATLVTGLVEAAPMLYVIVKTSQYRQKLTKESVYLLIINICWIASVSISNDNLGTATRLRLFTYVSLVVIYLQVIYSNEKTS